MLIFLIVISKWAYRELYPFHISLDCVFVYPSMPKVVGRGCFNKCPFPYLFLYANSPPDMKKVVSFENFPENFDLKK